MNYWYAVGDSWFPIYVNKTTGEEKTILGPNDILVDRDDIIPGPNPFSD